MASAMPGALFLLRAERQWETVRPESAGVSSAMYVIFSGRKHNGILWDAFCVRKMVLSSRQGDVARVVRRYRNRIEKEPHQCNDEPY